MATAWARSSIRMFLRAMRQPGFRLQPGATPAVFPRTRLPLPAIQGRETRKGSILRTRLMRGCGSRRAAAALVAPIIAGTPGLALLAALMRPASAIPRRPIHSFAQVPCEERNQALTGRPQHDDSEHAASGWCVT